MTSDQNTQSDGKRDAARECQGTLNSELVQSISLSLQSTGDNGDQVGFVELLGQLDNANGVAENLEKRLDGIMGSLDELLASLEPKDKPARESDQV